MSRWQNKRRAVMETDAEMAEFYIKRSCQQEVATESQSQQEIVCDSLSDAPTKVNDYKSLEFCVFKNIWY